MQRTRPGLLSTGLLILLAWPALAAIDRFLPKGTAALAHTPWAVWTFTPIILIPMGLAALWYRRGLSGTRDPLRRRIFFGAALALLFLVLQSPFEAYSDRIFTLHQIEHMALSTIGPLLLMLAAPQAALLRGMPGALRHWLVPRLIGKGVVHRAFAILSQPLPATLLFAGATDFWMVPAIHDASLRDPLVHEFWHFTLFLGGMIFFFRMLDPRPAPLGAPLLTRMLMCWVAEVNIVMLGFYLSFKNTVLYHAYGRMAPFWHISALDDERFGALTMWIPGAMMLAIGALVALHRSAEHEERQAAQRRARPAAPIRGAEFRARQAAGNRSLALGLLGFIGLVVVLTAALTLTYEQTIGRMDIIRPLP